MTKRLLYLLLILVFVACEKERPSGGNPSAATEHTVLLYMPGRSLYDYFKNNVEGVRDAVSKSVPGANNRILVCWQPDNNSTAQLLEIYYDRSKKSVRTKKLKSYTEFEASSSQSVGRLFADLEVEAPAEHYGLIIGCHGKAWVPASSGIITNSNRSRKLAEEAFWQPAPGALVTRSFGDPKHEMDIPDLAATLDALPYRFEYLIFDDCFMANAETLYELRKSVDYVVAAPCEIMGAGFPYKRIIPHLFADNATLANLDKVCWEFWNFYENDWNTINSVQSGCISIASMAQMDALATAMRRVNQSEKQAFDLATLQVYEGLHTHLFYDLGHYVSLSCADAAAREEFTQQLNQVILKRYNTPGFYSTYNGALNPITYYSGISFSEPSTRYTTENRQTSWYLATH